MRTSARAVVVGGGIVGASVLYHLARAGWTDSLLLDKGELASGSTWHAAGNTPHFNVSLTLSRVHLYGTELYAALPAETGQAVGFHRPGSLRLASVPDRMDEYRRHAGKARTIGLPFEVIGPDEVVRLHPLVDPGGLLGAAWTPADGHVDPTSVTRALVEGARRRGAEARTHTAVRAITRAPGGEWRVATDQGDVTAEVVVNAAGTWAREVGRMVGLDLPIVPMEHQYLVTGPVAELTALGREVPLLREVDVSYYLRQEGDGLLLGPYERGARPFAPGGLPPDYDGARLLPPDLARLQPIVEAATRRVPALGRAGVLRVVNGPITYTPDGNPLLGPAPGCPGLWLACGFSFGITQAGGAGRYLAEWIVEGQPPVDLAEVDPRRYGPYATPRYVRERCVDIYEAEYAIVYPEESRPAGRPARTAPLYERLRVRGARFDARGGWERPVWFAREGVAAEDRPSFRRPGWFDAVGAEVRAVRARAGLADQSSLAKIEVAGPGAEALLDRLCANRVPAPGGVAASPLLDIRGTFEGHVTVARLAPDRFLLVSAAGAEWRLLDWLDRHAPPRGAVRLDDVTGRWGALLLAGPRAPAVLARAAGSEGADPAFPCGTVRELALGFAPVRACRLDAGGEPAWGLHHPIEYQAHLHDLLHEAGRPDGLMDVGLRALDALRLEAGEPAWGSDLATGITPFQAGLDHLVALDKGEFLGRAALLAERRGGLRHRLRTLEVAATDADCWGAEAVWAGDRLVGITTSGGYGHWLRRSLAVAHLPIEAAAAGTAVEVEILGDRRPARVVAGPPWAAGGPRPGGPGR